MPDVARSLALAVKHWARAVVVDPDELESLVSVLRQELENAGSVGCRGTSHALNGDMMTAEYYLEIPWTRPKD